LCDRIWHVSFRSGEASWELLYSVYLYLYVLSVSFIYFFSPTLFYIDAVPSTGRCAALQYVLPPHGSVARTACSPAACALQWRRQDFVTGGVRYGPIGGLEYEVPQSRLYCPFINVALCSTALQCICRVIRRSSVTMKARTYYIIFGRPPIGGKLPPSPPGGATGALIFQLMRASVCSFSSTRTSLHDALRVRGHQFQLPNCVYKFHKRSFTISSLFRFLK